MSEEIQTNVQFIAVAMRENKERKEEDLLEEGRRAILRIEVAERQYVLGKIELNKCTTKSIRDKNMTVSQCYNRLKHPAPSMGVGTHPKP